MLILLDEVITFAQQDNHHCKQGSELAKPAHLYKLLVILEPNTVGCPHAVVVHDEHTLVASTAVMCPKRLHKVTLLAVGLLRLRQSFHCLLVCLKVFLHNLGVPQQLSNVPRVPHGYILVQRQTRIYLTLLAILRLFTLLASFLYFSFLALLKLSLRNAGM